VHLQANASMHDGLVALPRSCTCRDENGVETDGTDWYHINFLFFMEANMNTETSKTNVKLETAKSRYRPNTVQTRTQTKIG
jgi:hypothetical protein